MGALRRVHRGPATVARGYRDGKLVWWEQSAGGRTTFFGAGQSGKLRPRHWPRWRCSAAASILARLARLAWLAQRDAHGTWYSTQATVLALKAIGCLAPANQVPTARPGRSRWRGQRRGADADDPRSNRKSCSSWTCPRTWRRRQPLEGQETTGGGAGYQIAFRYHVPETIAAARTKPLAIDLAYDRTS